MLGPIKDARKCWKCLEKDAKKCLKCDERLEIQEMLKSRAEEEVYRQQYIFLEC